MSERYEIIVEGNYYKKVPGGTVIENFNEKFTLPTMEGALSIIQNELINPRLKSKDGACRSVRTCGISGYKQVESTSPGDDRVVGRDSGLPEGEQTTTTQGEHVDVYGMNKRQLAKFVADKNYDVDVEGIKLSEARKLVLQAIESNRFVPQEIEEENEEPQEDDPEGLDL